MHSSILVAGLLTTAVVGQTMVDGTKREAAYITSAPSMSYTFAPVEASAIHSAWTSAKTVVSEQSVAASAASVDAAQKSKALEDNKDEIQDGLLKSCPKGDKQCKDKFKTMGKSTGVSLELQLSTLLVTGFAVVVGVVLA